jgi:hypothetical protein
MKAVYLIIFILIFPNLYAAENTSACVVTVVEGKASLTDENNSKSVKINPGDKLKENDWIKTEKKSNVEIKISNSIVRIKENSMLKIAGLLAEGNTKKTNLFLKTGKALFKPEPQTEGSSFDAGTDTITTGVRGTEFVIVIDNKESKLGVNEGTVKVKKNIDVSSLEKLEKVKPELADEIKQKIGEENEVGSGKKFTVKQEDIKKIEQDLNNEVENAVKFIVDNQDNPLKVDEYVANFKTGKMNSIFGSIDVLSKISDISKSELNDLFNFNEFKDLNKIKEKAEDIKQKTMDLKKLFKL